jgi:hypothetical protein
VLGTLLIGLIGILVTGAVIRTMDKTELVAEAHGYGHGHDHDEVGECAEGEPGQGHGWGNGETGTYATGGSGRGRGGYGGQGREDAPGVNSTGKASVEEWLMLQGTVVSVDSDALVMQTASSGEQVTMENRAWWFAQEQGFSAQVGDQVTLVGFYENGDFEVGQINDATTSQTVLVRDENGQPLWAGRGRRSGGRWVPGSTS